MHIVYAVSTCSNKVYRQLFAHVEKKPAYHIQKYHRLMIEGLAANAKVDVVANAPVNPSVMDQQVIFLPDETEGGACYHYIPAIRNPYIKLACVGLGTFFKTLFLLRKDSAVVVDCLNRVAALAGLLAAKVRRCRCVCIVTDLPDLLGSGKNPTRVSNFIIRHSTDYVLLTQAMNEYLGNTAKPYVVLEGQSDVTMRDHIPSLDQKLQPRVCMYAGCISKLYGLGNLVDGFCMADIPDVQLHLYGPCDFVEELKELEPRVHYGGMLLNTEVVEKEMEATLLVNPRPTIGHEYVKYSFPSKTMEYMSTGTPVLTTKLPGMPPEYHPHVYFIEDETPAGVAGALKSVLAQSDEELFAKGLAARDFILNNRNNVIQARKILDMLKKGK